MKREESLLKLVCILVAAGCFVLIAYNMMAGGSIISTDGLFFTVVPLVLALCFLMVPAMGAVARQMEKRALARGSSTSQLATAGGGALPSAGGRTVPAAAPRQAPALKDTRGRAMPPDVNRMVAEMNAPRKKES
jgi:hypothetical protein